MDKQPQLILIADKDTGLFYDKTASIASYQFCRDSCIICYTSAPNRPYNYARSRVQVLTLQQTLDGKDHLVFVDGKQLLIEYNDVCKSEKEIDKPLGAPVK